MHVEQNRALRVMNSRSRILLPSLPVISASLGNSNEQGNNSQCLMIHVHLLFTFTSLQMSHYLHCTTRTQGIMCTILGWISTSILQAHQAWGWLNLHLWWTYLLSKMYVYTLFTPFLHSFLCHWYSTILKYKKLVVWHWANRIVCN